MQVDLAVTLGYYIGELASTSELATTRRPTLPSNSPGLTKTCSLVNLFSFDTDLALSPLSILCKKLNFCILIIRIGFL